METVKPETATLAKEQLADLKAQAMGTSDDGLRDFADFEQEIQAEPETPKAEAEGESTEGETDLAALLERLDHKERDLSRKAGEADYWRKEAERLRESRQKGSEQPEQPQQAQEYKPFKATPEDVDRFMAQYDPEWETNKGDDISRQIAQTSYDIAVNAVSGVMEYVKGLEKSVQEMQFGSQLGELGIDRETFREIVSDPRVAWLQKLSSQEQLEAIAQMRGLSGGRPSQATAQEPSAAGARTTSRARHHVEVGMGADNFQDPVTRNLSDLRSAHDKGDKNAARKAARPLWEQFLGR